MPNSTELEQLIRTRREGLGLEFKRSMNWEEPSTQGKVLRAALAFANKRDGGVLVFGIEATPGQPLHGLAGMSQGDFDSFEQDSVQSFVNAHAAPLIDLSVEHLTLDGHVYVAIIIREFADFPVICVKDFVVSQQAVVVKGRVYCRSRRMAESSEVRSPDDMRDIIDLATAKGIERYFRLRNIERRHEGRDPAQQYREQLGDLNE